MAHDAINSSQRGVLTMGKIDAPRFPRQFFPLNVPDLNRLLPDSRIPHDVWRRRGVTIETDIHVRQARMRPLIHAVMTHNAGHSPVLGMVEGDRLDDRLGMQPRF